MTRKERMNFLFPTTAHGQFGRNEETAERTNENLRHDARANSKTDDSNRNEASQEWWLYEAEISCTD